MSYAKRTKIFPNKPRYSGTCLCFAPDPTPAPTFAPTMSDAAHRWELFETTLCFGHDEHEAPHCGELMLAWWLAVVFAIIAAVLYEFVLIPCHACRNSRQHGTPYKKALKHAFTHQCWCFTKRGREEEHAHHARESGLSHDSILSWATAESTESVQMGSTLAAPFLLDVAAQGGEEGAYADLAAEE